MKKLITCLIVLVLLAVSVTPALAAGKDPPKGAAKQGATTLTEKTPRGNAFGHLKKGAAGIAEASEQETPDKFSLLGVRAAKQRGKSPVSGTAVGAGPKASRAFVLGGTILSVDPISKTMTVAVYYGNRVAQGAYSTTVTITLSSGTRYQMWTPDGTGSVALDELDEGQNVMIKGWTDGEDWSADWLKVDLGLARKLGEPSQEEETTAP
jgi:hypothetical protein